MRVCILTCVCVCVGADPAELENMRDALEEAQRWNASLQARLGQIQSRGGGVGQANDMGMMYTCATGKSWSPDAPRGLKGGRSVTCRHSSVQIKHVD